MAEICFSYDSSSVDVVEDNIVTSLWLSFVSWRPRHLLAVLKMNDVKLFRDLSGKESAISMISLQMYIFLDRLHWVFPFLLDTRLVLVKLADFLLNLTCLDMGVDKPCTLVSVHFALEIHRPYYAKHFPLMLLIHEHLNSREKRI